MTLSYNAYKLCKLNIATDGARVYLTTTCALRNEVRYLGVTLHQSEESGTSCRRVRKAPCTTWTDIYKATPQRCTSHTNNNADNPGLQAATVPCVGLWHTLASLRWVNCSHMSKPVHGICRGVDAFRVHMFREE